MAVAVRGGREVFAGVVLHIDQGRESGFRWSSSPYHLNKTTEQM
jgi:hypothetical protein